MDCNDGCPTILDTGTPGIGGPDDAMIAINNIIGAKYDKSGSAYVNCDDVDDLPVIGFNFGGKRFDLEAKDYIAKVHDGQQEQCLSLFDGGLEVYILGDNFLRKYYSEYDLGNSRIGLAKAATSIQNRARLQVEHEKILIFLGLAVLFYLNGDRS